jgi:Family of unknown function (DUF5906)
MLKVISPGGFDPAFDELNPPPNEGRDRVLVKGVERRVTTIASLNKRYGLLQTNSDPSIYVDRRVFRPIQEVELRRILGPEVVYAGEDEKTGKPVFISAYTAWSLNADQHVYTSVAFTSKPTPNDTFNLYRGLGAKPAPGKYGLIRKHIEEVICSGSREMADQMIKLMAWQLQNIGRPSRIVVVMKSEKHQAGKGILLGDVLARIYGPSGFVPSTMDQVLGRFNDAVRGRAFIFLDEILFAGDRRAADAVKSLSTCSAMGIETKGLPIVTCPVGVNLWLASNHDNAAHIEETDARYWVINVSEHRIGDAAYFAALHEEIDGGGREAFAHHLLTLDVSGFVPWRDIKKDTQAKRAMIRESINPFDARKWIEDCCQTERLIGAKTPSGEWKAWSKGDEPFATLSAAYVEWQKTVKSPVAPRPTAISRLGQVLTAAGIEAKVSKDGNTRLRVLPAAADCLGKLWGPPAKSDLFEETV